MITAMKKPQRIAARKLTELTGFRVIGEEPYIGPKNTPLTMRYLASDGVHDAEISLIRTLCDLGKVDPYNAVAKSVVPHCCEECGGTKFVQMLVLRNGRVIEVLVCASGIEVSYTSDRTRPCIEEHSVVRGAVSGLAPSPRQIESADAMLSRALIDARRDKTQDVDDDPDKDGLDDLDEDFPNG